jgi:hypothetical protein
MSEVIVQQFFCAKCGAPLRVQFDKENEGRQRLLVERCDYCFQKQYESIDHAVTLIAALVKRGKSLNEIDDAVSEYFHKPATESEVRDA